MTEGQDAGVPETLTYDTWWLDFSDAIVALGRDIPVIMSWTQIQSHHHRLDEEKPSFQQVSAAFTRDVVRIIATTTNRKNFRAGATFGPTFGNEGTDSEDKGMSSDAGRRPKPTAGQKRKRTKEAEEITCIGCDSFTHKIDDCYMAFPEKAFEGFRATTGAKRAWQKNQIKKEVQDAIQKIKKTKVQFSTASSTPPRMQTHTLERPNL